MVKTHAGRIMSGKSDKSSSTKKKKSSRGEESSSYDFSVVNVPFEDKYSGVSTHTSA